MSLLAAPLELFFKLLYNQFAWCYDWVAAIVSIGRWNDWVSAVIPHLSGTRILELGHGPGHLQLRLANHNFRTYGIDASRQMGRLAYHRLRGSGFSPRLVNGLGQRLPFVDGVFDQVVATFPSGYIFEAVTLSGIFQVLVPGGTLVVLPYAWIGRNNILDRLAASVFRITGQAPDWNTRLAEPFIAAGFEIKLIDKHLASSEVMVIIASRPL